MTPHDHDDGASSPMDELRPTSSLWDRVRARIGSERSIPASAHGERGEHSGGEHGSSTHGSSEPGERGAHGSSEAGERGRPAWVEPSWESPAPGIECKILSADIERDRVSMLVRLAPGVAYPAHQHAGREELHLLEGELEIDGRMLYPGDFNRAEVGTADAIVRTTTGCTCLLITSTRDLLR